MLAWGGDGYRRGVRIQVGDAKVYPFIAAEKARAGNVQRACQLLSVSRSAYYTWSKHRPTPHQQRDVEHVGRIIQPGLVEQLLLEGPFARRRANEYVEERCQEVEPDGGQVVGGARRGHAARLPHARVFRAKRCRLPRYVPKFAPGVGKGRALNE